MTTPSSLEDPDVARFIEDLELDQDQHQLLTILLNPANDPSESAGTASEMLELLESIDDFDPSQILELAGRFGPHYERLFGGYAAFGFDLMADSDGFHDSYQVRVTMPELTYLTRTGDTKHLDPQRYEFTGVKAALHIAGEINSQYQQLRTVAAQLFTTQQVQDALNGAADEIQELAPDNDLIGDATNLLVNATLHYLDHHEDTLADVVAANFKEKPS